MYQRMKDAVSDAAETLRRAFAGLKVVEVAPEPFRLRSHRSAALRADSLGGLEAPAATAREMRLLHEAVEGRTLEPFHAVLQAEAGWASWGVEAEVVRMTPLTAGQGAQLTVPPLPRRAKTLGRLEPPAHPALRRWLEPVGVSGVRRLDPALEAGSAQPGLGAMLALAVPIQGENIQHLPKGQWMRYSLQLVRGTGENVRNLEVLGLFRLPRRGVADLRHDPRQGRLLVQLQPLAIKAERAPFILARRKDDGGLVSCFVEDP